MNLRIIGAGSFILAQYRRPGKQYADSSGWGRDTDKKGKIVCWHLLEVVAWILHFNCVRPRTTLRCNMSVSCTLDSFMRDRSVLPSRETGPEL
eukprot:2370855-Amphidinium_carterae.2